MQPVRFELLSSQQAELEAARYLSQYLSTTVSHRPTLLLLSGGSAITMYAQMVQPWVEQKQPLNHVMVSLVDERFGVQGHPDSNATQLEQAGVITDLQALGAEWIPFLEADQQSGEQVAVRMTKRFQELQSTHQLIVLAGLGDDAHTAGLLPTNDEETIERVYHSSQAVVYYELPSDTDNPFRLRLTITPSFLAATDRVIVYAKGDKKRAALRRFVTTTEPIQKCPALALRAARDEIVVLTDQQESDF